MAAVVLTLRRSERLGRPLRYDAFLGVIFGLAFFSTLLWWLNVIGHEAYAAVVAVESVFLAVTFTCVRLVLRYRLWPAWASLGWLTVEDLRSAAPFGGLPWGAWPTPPSVERGADVLMVQTSNAGFTVRPNLPNSGRSPGSEPSRPGGPSWCHRRTASWASSIRGETT